VTGLLIPRDRIVGAKSPYRSLSSLEPCARGRPWHILVYMPNQARRSKTATAQRKAKVFMNNRSQAVRLPKDFQFNTQEVFIRKEGNDVVLSPRPSDWSSYLTEAPVASAAFMDGVEDLPVQEREP